MMVLLGLVESYIRALTLTGLEPLMAPYHQYFSIVIDALEDLDLYTIDPLPPFPHCAFAHALLPTWSVFPPPLSTWRTTQTSIPAQVSGQESEDTNSSPGLAFNILIRKQRVSDRIMLQIFSNSAYHKFIPSFSKHFLSTHSMPGGVREGSAET